ncbi:hypothetical protein CYQ72_12640 [Enterococcus faecium]|uniref:hypothetical protein n=1 Tax=Enterococcus faecium TaxID=1352 RepID=UPI00100FCDB4|nr:hypothetical protein [Enterococcus faecium]RXW34615.1 hypothetical protein CYQ87_12630 [Enterococcus faecium]RXW60240.1 hypothetical protein CYQ72_12640 [Enterococcus faecium]RXW88165.1 hypothetical protein CYQ63_09425 [Enterococcus faecium]TKO30521.1 hypothetical protein DVX74_09395 [Enterococcus faecium]TKQ65693.1 hypothetical protein DV460_12565 [Enterococcus faecium]
MGSSVKAFVKVLSSNFIVMFLGILTTLIFPKHLGPLEYGEYQLYLFYASFLGFFLLGYCDGLYLRYGGTEYSSLDKVSLNKDFKFITIYLIFVSSIFYIIFTKFGVIDNKIVLLLSISIFIHCLNSFFVLINQASGRFNVYSITNIIEKFILAMYGIFVFVKGDISINFLFGTVILGKLTTLCINILFDIDIIMCKSEPFSIYFFRQVYINIKAGLPLTISGVSSMLITGFGRNKVQNELGNKQFGIYSLVFSLMSIVTQVISAVSIVFYPFLKNSEKRELKRNLRLIDEGFVLISLIINLMFFPMYLILKFYLIQYLSSATCLFILLPTLISQAKISILYNTYYKVLRKEKIILLNGILTLVIAVFLTNVFFSISGTIEAVALATLLSFLFWERISRINLYRVFELKIDIKVEIKELMLPFIFVVLNLMLDPLMAFIIYLFFVLTYGIYQRKNICQLFFFIINKQVK